MKIALSGLFFTLLIFLSFYSFQPKIGLAEENQYFKGEYHKRSVQKNQDQGIDNFFQLNLYPELESIDPDDDPLATPFNCATTEFYFTLQLDFSVLDPNDIASGLQTPFNLPSNVNATGYNPNDNYIYTISSGGSNSGNPLRIHSDGTIEDLGDIGLPISPYIGAFDPDGLWYVKDGSNTVYIIDLVSFTYTTQIPSQNFGAADWAYHYIDDVFYGVGGSTLYSYDPVSNSVTTSTVSGFDPIDGGTYGAAFYNSDENIYVYNNSSGNLYAIDVNAGTATNVFQGPSYGGAVDGCACPFAPPPPPDLIAINDTFCLNQNGQQIYFILENDEVSFANLDFSTFNVLEGPLHGSVTFNSSNGSLTYTANGTQLLDSLVYEICCDGETVVCDWATIYILPYEEVNFDQLGPYCVGEVPDILGPVSNEGVSGSWSPQDIDTDVEGNYDYIFTPFEELHPCAESFIMNIEIMPLEIPVFDDFGPYCQYEEIETFPEISNNGISGSWDPVQMDSDIPGEYVFTFTPDESLHPCGLEEIVFITIMEEEPSSFDSLGPYCQHQEADWLPNTSNEGVFGSWSPDLIQTDEAGVFSYTFTPDPDLHPCGLETNLYVTIIEEDIPSFDLFGPYCIGEDPDELPSISNEGIEGQWYPATIETSIAGEYDYTFIPDGLDLPCALETNITIIVTEGLSPAFNLPESICLNDTNTILPNISLEGIEGSWSPAEIISSNPGSYQYIFTPENDESNCIQESTWVITVSPKVEISLVNRICSEDLLSYDLIFEISGGSITYDSIFTSGYTFVALGNNKYQVDTIASGTGLNIEVWDSLGCNALLNVGPYDCDCPDMPDPSGAQDISYCFGNNIGSLSIDDPGENYQINWLNEEGDLMSHDNPFFPSGPGIFLVSLIDTITGCQSNDTLILLVEEIPPITIDILETECAEDLQSYQVLFSVSGGTGNYTQLSAESYYVTDNNDGTYILEGISSSTAVQIIVEDDENCMASLSIMPPECDCPFVDPPIIPENEIYYCFGDAVPKIIAQDPGAGFEIQWFDVLGNYIQNGLEFTPDSSGSYLLGVIQTVNQCISDPIQVIVIENQEIEVIVNSEFCENETGPFSLSFIISGGSPPYYPIVESYAIDTIAENEFLITNLPNLNPVFLEVFDSLGCQQEIMAKALILPLPEGDAGPDRTISCIDGLAKLEAEVDIGQITCSWFGPDPNITILETSAEVEIPGMYYLEMTDMNTACSSLDSVFVFPPEFPEFDFTLHPVICHNENSGGIIFADVENGKSPYLFSIDGGINFTFDPLFNDIAAGNYHLLVKDDLGCLSDTLIYLENPLLIELYIESPIELAYGETHQIEVLSNLHEDAISIIQWTPSNGLSCTDCLNPIADPKENTQYELILVDTLGCAVNDSILIIRKVDTGVYIPNVFSPNNDGSNDMFYVKGGNGVESVESLEIYDRWGNFMFHLKNFPLNAPEYGWDGRCKGEMLNPGVYVYKIVVKFIDGRKEILSGDITLLR